MTCPTLPEMAAEADAWRALAEARDDYYRRGASERAHERLLAAFDTLRALGVCAFTSPAVLRISEPERLGDILERTMCDEAYAATDEPSEIANVIGDVLEVRGKR